MCHVSYNYRTGEESIYCVACGKGHSYEMFDLDDPEHVGMREKIQKALDTKDFDDIVNELDLDPEKDIETGIKRWLEQDIFYMSTSFGGHGTYIVTENNGASKFGTLPEPGEKQDELIEQLKEHINNKEIKDVKYHIYRDECFFDENGNDISEVMTAYSLLGRDEEEETCQTEEN
jgi:hypothetical protein